ncbi:ergothioneine biosynthesis protein EgtB [Pseudoalteromonas sp. S1727]|uniref:ergothioneine biosynthesis protein EgtB n=1 Tax=Pseudoalteromonas sp. S1727 TaxID=2066514 RepID=UPI001107AB5D|nr:ergothioneine biosynthesis protein EgtB [Pseudoalteromonas sp. S1727]TMN70445.1 ergothioneine biosynthesis protein EgtB [Pseudoalteromonas sp. S1727]
MNFTSNAKYEEIASLINRYHAIRQHSVNLIAELSAEDCQLQAMADVSPSKWHLAHTTWFFETFLLTQQQAQYQVFDSAFKVLFNSYYNGIGDQYSRASRGALSRPSLESVLGYRRYVDNAVLEFLNQTIHVSKEIADIIELGLNHEQQHQELMLMDIKYNFSINPLFPHYYDKNNNPVAVSQSQVSELNFVPFSQQIIDIGAAESDFSYDNERPKHQVFIQPFRFANRLITNGEYLAFMQSGGYQNPEHWLSDGWAQINKTHQTAPLYWHKINNEWFEFTLHGLQPLALAEPVTHITFYEASAYAHYCNARLPTEFEWEYAAAHTLEDQFKQSNSANSTAPVIEQLTEHCWQWTNSAYLPYPGFKPVAGVAGEYNGKFMANQMVLRGGCKFTPKNHLRLTYRNFYYPYQAWMRSGIRLAKD